MDPLFSETMRSWFEWILLWIGFGTCVGLLAKALMPGRDPGGAIATLLMGVTGVAIGCGVYALVYGERVTPISSVGLVCGTLGAVTLLDLLSPARRSYPGRWRSHRGSSSIAARSSTTPQSTSPIPFVLRRRSAVGVFLSRSSRPVKKGEHGGLAPCGRRLP